MSENTDTEGGLTPVFQMAAEFRQVVVYTYPSDMGLGVRVYVGSCLNDEDPEKKAVGAYMSPAEAYRLGAVLLDVASKALKGE